MYWHLKRVCDVLREALPLIMVKPSREVLPLGETVGYYSAVNVVARVDVPHYDRSAVDGYALRAEETSSASPYNPALFKLIGGIEVGAKPDLSAGPGECVEVATGAPMPRGANAVVMLEDTRRRGSLIEVLKPLATWENVSKQGEDLKAGTLILKQGDRVQPWHIAALASQGMDRLEVYAPRIALASTGSELVEPGWELPPGRVYNYTGYLIKAWLIESKCRVVYRGLLSDSEDIILEALEEMLKVSDAVIVTGGTSVGRKDYTVRAVKRLDGLEYLAHGLALRPGKPTALAVVDGKPILAVSGLPVAALAALDVVFRPVLMHMCQSRLPVTKVKARLARKISKPPGLLGFIRVRVYRRGNGLYVEPVRLSGSGVISSLLKGNGILLVEEDLEGLEQGEIVEVELYEEPEDLS